MKQETINLIKSMTEQGFLVIVDPEKLKGEGSVMIEVIDWKENDNGVEISSTADDEKINAEIAELAGFKKEEPKPKIDLLQCDGRRFRAKIEGVECEGKIRVDYDIDYGIYLCNDKKDNAWRAVDKFEYRCAWFMRTDRSDFNTSITDFELLPEPKVIFTNCVGEVFTEEDVKKNIEVWVGSISGKGLNKILNCPICDLTRDIFRGNDYETDIFRSKKSLLKYLYETCD